MNTQIVSNQFGSREEVKELAERVQKMLPGGNNYTQAEALTLAQIAVAHDLDPFNGEVWLIKGNDGKVYGALIGIKGHRKHAKKQANYWGVGNNGGFERVTDPQKFKEYKAPEGSIIYEYRIMDDVTGAAYTNSIANLIKAGIPFEQIQVMFGPPPITLGVGIWSPGEQTKMKPHQCAMFRAEKDALKRRFDVQFRLMVDGHFVAVKPNGDEELEADEVDGEYDEYIDEARDESDVLEELGYSDNGNADPAAKLVADGKVDNVPHARNIINKRASDCPLDEYAFAVAYQGWRDMGADSKKAAEFANKGEAPK